MSKFANHVKALYEDGLWTKAQVRAVLDKGRITAAEYEEITGEPAES